MAFKNSLFILFSLVLFSCKNEHVAVDVSFNSDTQSGVLVMDGKTKFKLPKDSTSITITIPEGTHTFKLNKEKVFQCAIPDEGGILNLNNERFVTITETYQTNENSLDFHRYSNRDFVVIDSLVYIIKNDTTTTITDQELKTYIEEEKKSGYALSSVKLYKAEKFIKKDWDYGLGQDFPEEIEIYTSKYSNNSSDTKTKILQANLFMMIPFVEPKYMEVRSLKDVMSGKNDKAVDSNKKDAQMKMD
ncbi:MAG: hypothetical protein QM535_07930 [Limnohabitans sp.]|nr:hypothetical protein [Limnohabitans sp.]